jgi:hypothetical protein
MISVQCVKQIALCFFTHQQQEMSVQVFILQRPGILDTIAVHLRKTSGDQFFGLALALCQSQSSMLDCLEMNQAHCRVLSPMLSPKICSF